MHRVGIKVKLSFQIEFVPTVLQNRSTIVYSLYTFIVLGALYLVCLIKLKTRDDEGFMMKLFQF